MIKDHNYGAPINNTLTRRECEEVLAALDKRIFQLAVYRGEIDAKTHERQFEVLINTCTALGKFEAFYYQNNKKKGLENE